MHRSTYLGGEWLDSVIFHGNIKCITANRSTDIYVGADYIHTYCVSHNDHSFHAKFLGSTKSFLIYTYGFTQCHMIGIIVH